jgi:hypothetical protein
MNRDRRCVFMVSVLLASLVTAGVGCQFTPSTLTPAPRETAAAVSPSGASPSLASATPTLTPLLEADSPPVPAETTESGGEGFQFWLPAVAASDPTPTDPPPAADLSPGPTAKATRGPDWPEPLAAPGPSKLGLHVVRNNSPWIMEFVRRVRPAVVKAVDDVGWLSDVKRESPTTVTIGRLAPTHQDMNGDPALAAQAFVAEQLTRYQLNRGVDYWEGWNEPDPNQNMAWYATFEAERVRLLAEHGFGAAVGGFAVGVPEWDEFLAFLPAIEAARQYGGILTLHEYGAPTMDFLVGSPLPGWPGYPDRGVLALRYRWWYQEILIPRGLVVPLVISEAGIDGIAMAGQRPGPDGLGWQDFISYWDDVGLPGGTDGYLQQLAWYDSELQRDGYVIGFTLFTAGAGHEWESYDVNDILPRLARYVSGVE